MTAVAVVTLATVGVVGGSAEAASTTPGRVRAVHATDVAVHGAHLTWRNPARKNFTNTEVRVARGTHAPRNVHEGRRVAFVASRHHSLSVTGLAGGSVYSFALFATDGHGHRARPAFVRATTRLDAPVTPRAYDTGASTTIAWRNPGSSQLRRVVVRYARGAAAPTSLRAGTGARLEATTAARAVLTGLAPEAGYSVSIFAVDRAGRASAPGVVRFTTRPKDVGPEPAPRPGTYSGLVVDSAGTPLIGADVIAERYDADDEEIATTTGTDGTFTLSLPPGDWYVGANGEHAAGGNSDGTGYVYDGDLVTIAPGATTSDARFVLTPGALLSGRIVDTAGRPVAGAKPYLGLLSPYVQVPSNDFFSIFYDTSGEDATGADGTWTLRGIAPGYAFQLCASADDGTAVGVQGSAEYLNRCSTRATVLATGASKTLPDLALTRADAAGGAGTVVGHVRGADRHPLTGTAYLEPANGSSAGKGGSAVLARDGSFRVDGVAAGGYHVCGYPLPTAGGARSGYVPGCSAATVVVRAGATSSGDVVLAVGAGVGGRVASSDGRNLAGVEVTVQAVTEDDDDSGPSVSVTSDSHGRWAALGLPEGDYTVCYANDDTTVSPTGVLGMCRRKGEPVSLVTGRLRTGIDQSLAAAGAITGTVTDVAGRPVPYVQLTTDAPSQGPYDDEVYAQSDRSGHYVLKGLTAARHKVCFDTEDFDTAGVHGCLREQPVVRLGRVTGGADLRVPAPTAISVRVVDIDGTPVAAVDAVAFARCTSDSDSDGDDEEDCDNNPVLGERVPADAVSSRLTDGDGTAVLDGLDTASYAVCLFGYFGTTVSGGSPTGYADVCHGGASFDVRVTRGHTTSVAMTLRPGGSVSGRVTDTAGRPVAHARLVVAGSAAEDYRTPFDDALPVSDGADSSGWFGDDTSPRAGSLTAADGTYSVIGVRPGSRTVCVDPSAATGSPSGYLARCRGAAPGTTTGGTPVTVTASTDTRAGDVQLTPGAALAGRVTVGGRPFDDATVIVFSGRSLRDESIHYSRSDGSGRWSVTALPAGSYTVCATSDDTTGQCWRGVAWGEDDEPPLARATLIPASSGATRGGVDFALRRH